MAAPTAVSRRRRPWIGVLCMVPVLAVTGAAFTLDATPDEPVAHVQQEVGQGPQLRECPGPMSLPEGLETGSGDAELATGAPSDVIGLRAVAVEPDSSLLFGRTSGSTTLQDDDGNIRSPSITTTPHSEDGEDGDELDTDVLSEDLGASVQSVDALGAPAEVDVEASQGGGALADAVQSTLTDDGDYRSLTLSRCATPAVQATFLGMGTTAGSSSVLFLRNTTERPATASIQIWTADGPASMDSASSVVVGPGESEQVLLESVAADEDVLGVSVDTVGAPLGMAMQTTERDGLTPGGAEIQTPPAPADTELMIPGVHAGSGTTAEAVVMNETGEDAEVELLAQGTGGEIDLGDAATLEVPAGTVQSVPLEGAGGEFALSATSNTPVSVVTRSTVESGTDLGDTIGSPVDLSITGPAPALQDADVLALPVQGPRGLLSLSATEETTVTVIPLAADGSAGEVAEHDVGPDSLTTIAAGDLEGTDDPPAGVMIVPERAGAVHGAWVQVDDDADGEPVFSSIPVTPNLPEAASGDVRLG